jgi:hypothetical protein
MTEFNRNRRRHHGIVHPFLTGVHEPIDGERTLDELGVPHRVPLGFRGNGLPAHRA